MATPAPVLLILAMSSINTVSYTHLPLADVEGFIRNDGKDYLLSGSWKVYHDPDGAQALFRAYDHARDCAVRELLQGRKMREIAVQAA